MTFYDVVSGDELQTLKSSVVAKQSEIWPNQPCRLSLLPLSYIISASWNSMSDDL